MIAKKLKLHNFYSHTDTELVFDKDIYIILGEIVGTNKSNGSGKSTIVKAINYALNGDATDDERNTRSLQVKGDNLIYNDATEMEVDYIFELEEDEYRVRRVLKRGSTASVYISKNGSKEIKHGVKAAQEIIQKIIGADYNIFKNTSYFQQGDLNSFSKLTPKAAKDVVMRILQLDIYNKYEQEAKDQVSLIKDKIRELEGNFEVMDGFLKQQKEKDSGPKYSKKDLAETNEKLEELKFHKKLQEFWNNSKNRHIDFINDHMNKVRYTVSKIDAEIRLVDQRVSKLTKLSGAKKCPTCEQTLKKEDIESIINLLKNDLKKRLPKAQKLHEAMEHLKEAKAEILTYTFSLVSDNIIIETSQQLAVIKAELRKVIEEDSKLKELSIKKEKIENELKEQRKLLDRYTELQKTFGRNGIPAYIIENVIPEIETTANDILQGLDTNIRISIESQKDLKKGGKAETLDINIVTEYGERPYANYSGGQQSLIDFSIRMALAIILARRSNCKIQTLILDEVFGELDPVNKQIVAKAIKYIAKRFDFKRILVISHAEELQDTCKNIIKIQFDGRKSYVK